jgi:hypothetical protein
MSDINSSTNILPIEKVSSTGGNTSAYESTGVVKGGKKKTGKRRINKGLFLSLKKLLKWRKTARRSRKRL